MSAMTSIAVKPKILDNVIWRQDGENNQIVVLSKEGLPLPLILNPTAARIFLLCDGCNSIEGIAKVLADEFSISGFGMVLEDVKKQVEFFLEKQVVQI